MRRITPALLIIAAPACAQWAQLPDFPGTPRDDAAFFTLNGMTYVGTGMEVGWGLTNDWYRFDPGSSSWSAIASMPATPRQYCTAFTILDTAYVFGGIDGNGALNELWAYHPQSDSWEQKASLPAMGRYTCTAAGFLFHGYVTTGMLSDGTPTNETWVYEASTDSWSAGAPLPAAARHRAAFFSASSLVVVGGADAGWNALADAWEYPIVFPTGQWYPLPDLPEVRWGAKGAGEHAMVIGGATDQNTFHADGWMLRGNAWQAVPAFGGGPRRGAATGHTTGLPGKVFFGTGLGSDMERRNDWWELEVPVGVAEHAKNGLLLFPNPAEDRITLLLPHGLIRPGVRIMDMLGRTVLSGTLEVDGRINVGTFAPGRYEVVVLHGESLFRTPFIKLP